MSFSFVEKYQLSPETEKTMVTEYSYLLYVGGLLINYRPKVWIISIAQTSIFIGLITSYTIIFIISTAKSSNFVAFSQNLNYASLCCICLGLYFAGLSHRSAFVRLMEIIHDDFYDYGDSFDNAEVAMWKSSLRTFKIIIVVGIPTYLIIIAVSIVLGDYIDTALGYDSTDEDYLGEIYQKAPLNLWYPFVVTNMFLRVAVTLSQMTTAAILATTLATGDVMMLFLGQTVALQLRILCLAATKMDQRANLMYEKGLARSSSGDKEDLDGCYKLCIKQLVQHHLIIKEFYKTYYTIAKWPTAIAFMNGSLMIAMSIIVAMNGNEETPSTYISTYLLLVAEVLSMWLLCETGQNVNTWSEKLFMDTYEFNWNGLSVPNKKMLLIFKENIKKPLLMMAGGLTPINRDTFATIMNTSYSYVNLLRASERRSND
uniref:Odorant receptor n=1 Tax=Apolygus lucorum TaxID=248454 RepID=A0A0U2EYY5_APOLU|nr:olfactory receptor 18 [Apolygus lucorum]